jgi:hypothetical protein
MDGHRAVDGHLLGRSNVVGIDQDRILADVLAGR